MNLLQAGTACPASQQQYSIFCHCTEMQLLLTHAFCYVQIYSKARLNIHPCLYDAYGMTIVEAASQGE